MLLKKDEFMHTLICATSASFISLQLPSTVYTCYFYCIIYNYLNFCLKKLNHHIYLQGCWSNFWTNQHWFDQQSTFETPDLSTKGLFLKFTYVYILEKPGHQKTALSLGHSLFVWWCRHYQIHSRSYTGPYTDWKKSTYHTWILYTLCDNHVCAKILYIYSTH